MASPISQTASSSSSPWNTSFFPGCKYDIFLSFRGKDTRYGFTDHLYRALVEKGIHTFRDKERIRRGQYIDHEIQQAIDGSKMFIIIFSENYANSQWCLTELVEIMKCRARGQKVFPIFYHVDPADVGEQSGKYEEAFIGYENDANPMREIWRTALSEAGNRVAGWEIEEKQYEAGKIREITRDMICEIAREQCNEDGLVGTKPRLNALKKLIKKKPEDVLMVGIYGVGDIGKTTIARALYDEISCQFEGASFLANIGEVSEEDVLYCLQDRIFCDILFGGENQEIRHFHIRNVMKDKIRCKKVLIVLDDVNNEKQLQVLLGQHDWFGNGSRIIITTKYKHLLDLHEVDESYEHEELNPFEALALLSHHANTRGKFLNEVFSLSKEVIEFCYLRPLALKVVGSFLRGKSRLQWKVQMDDLARQSAREIFRVGYNALNREEQYMFLDLACFFKGEYKHFVTKILNEHDFSAENGVKVLTDRCLITVSERKIWMPSVIQKLGRDIDREPGKLCRLWDHKDVERLSRTKKDMDVVEGISLDLSKSNQIHFSTEDFAKMTELKLLKFFLGTDCVDGKEIYKLVDPSEGFGLPCSQLRYLHWHGYELEFYPSNVVTRKLLELNMPYSRLKQINRNEIDFPKLTVLNLSQSQHLENISNFSSMPNLERLVLEGCRSLVEVDKSIGDLNKLSLMNLKDCKMLNCLPKSIGKLNSLETLILTGCSGLEKLPNDLEELQSLLNLKANGTSIRGINLPPKLRILHLGHCKRLQGIPKLPSSIEEVDAYNCISMGTSLWETNVALSILQRIQNTESEFSILLPGNRIPDDIFTHKMTRSSMTMKLPIPDWYNDDFLGFAVCLVFAPKAEKPHLNPEILCELENFTFFYSCGDEFAESDEERGNKSTDYVWLAYRARAQADRCHPKKWNQIKVSFEVFDCEVKECAICLIYKSKGDNTEDEILGTNFPSENTKDGVMKGDNSNQEILQQKKESEKMVSKASPAIEEVVISCISIPISESPSFGSSMELDLHSGESKEAAEKAKIGPEGSEGSGSILGKRGRVDGLNSSKKDID